MATHVPVSFHQKPNQSIDEIGLTVINAALKNAYLEFSAEAGITVKRKGLSLFKDTASFKKIDGLFWWEELHIVIVVSDGNIYKVTGLLKQYRYFLFVKK